MEKIEWTLGPNSEHRQDYAVRRVIMRDILCVEVEYRYCNPQYPPDPDGSETYIVASKPILEALVQGQSHSRVVVITGSSASSSGVGDFSKSDMEGWTKLIHLPTEQEVRAALTAFLG